jgi:16S rRNA (uracil1498-N3)-methyltransferase
VPAFLVEPAQVRDGRIVLEGPEAHHLSRVRRHRVGDQVQVLDGSGRRYRVMVEAIGPDRVDGRILGYEEDVEAACQLVLAPALIKGQRFDWIVEKATELGVAHLCPVVAARSVPTGGSADRFERWQRLARAAAKQSGRPRLPDIEAPAPLPQVLERLSGQCDLFLVAEPQAAPLDLAGQRLERVGLLIGPEGGFAAEEATLVAAAGGRAFSWGQRILRADTAAVALAAVVLHEIERSRTGTRGG